MSSNKEQNKELILKAKQLFKDKGYEVKTSHLYDIFAQLSGYKNWHVASIKNEPLANAIKNYITESPHRIDKKNYLDYVNNFFYNLDNKTESFDLFSPNCIAHNYLISGDTGSGKSILLQKILTTEIMKFEKPVIAFLDCGGDVDTYSKFIEINKGVTIDVFKDLPHFNLFSLKFDNEIKATPLKVEKVSKILYEKFKSECSKEDIKAKVEELYEEWEIHSLKTDRFKQVFQSVFDFRGVEYDIKKIKKELSLNIQDIEPTDQKIMSVINVIQTMIFNEDKSLSSAFDWKYFYPKIKDMYRKIGNEEKRFPTISDFLNFIDDENVKNKLFKWSKNGEFPMFDTILDIDLSSDLLKINFKSKSFSLTVLEKVYYNLFNSLISNKLLSITGRRKILVQEEVSMIFRNDFVESLMINLLRVARRSNISVILTSQSLTEIAKETNGKYLLHNIHNHIIGRSSPKEVEAMTRELNLSKDSIDGLRQAGVNKSDLGLFSRFLFKFSYNKELFLDLKLTLMEMLTFCLNKEENYKINLLKKEKKISLEESLIILHEEISKKITEVK